MPSTPWTIQRKQMKTPSTAPAARKKARLSDDVGRRVSSASRSRSQQTLTQIAFVNSPQTSFEEDVDLEEIRPLPGGKQDEQRAAKPRNKSKKRDSTLTQMPWLKDHTPVPEPLDETLLSDTNREVPKESRIVQFDGAYDSPRKPRKRKSVAADIYTALDVFDEEEKETQDYLPSKKRKTDNTTKSVDGSVNRRRSGRLVSKSRPLSEYSDMRSKFFENGLYSKVEDTRNSITETRPPVLEIADSTEFNSDEPPTTEQNRRHQSVSITPRKVYIPSSQTPESRSRTIKRLGIRTDLSPSKALTRTPLGDRDPNLPPRLLRSNQKRKRQLFSPQNSPGKQSPVRKICVLKVPRPGLLSRRIRVEDSQDDIYSLQPTSSARKSTKTPSPPQHGSNEQVGQETTVDASSVSKDSNSHSLSTPPNIDTQHSLPTISDLISTRPNAMQQPTRHDSNGSNDNEALSNNVAVRHFGTDHPLTLPLPPTSDRAVMSRTSSVVANRADKSLAAANDDMANEDLSDFGSPILNDTQFIADLDQRTSSPVPNHDIHSSAEQDRHDDGAGVQDDVAMDAEQTVSSHPDTVPTGEYDAAIAHVLPTPQLVHTSELTAAETQSIPLTVAYEEPVLPQRSQRSDFRTSTKKVRLNDAVPESFRSTLPSQYVHTQKSVYPASLLRPSQVSTQDPTQNYFLSSMVHGAHDPDSDDEDVDRISIKDSSSVIDQPLDRIRQHQGRSQSQGRDMRLTTSSDNETDDLDLNVGKVSRRRMGKASSYLSTAHTEFDLDPASAPQHSVRKEFLRTSSRMDSNMKSIHASSSDHEQHKASSPPVMNTVIEDEQHKTLKSQKETTTWPRGDFDQEVLDLLDDIPTSSPSPPPLKRKYSPIAGFDNETQSNFTQGGTVTAAYIHRQREAGLYPEWFVPKIPPKTTKRLK